MLGRRPPGAVYQCVSCQSADFIPERVLTRPRPGQPWKQDKSGVLAQCSGCGRYWVITPSGLRPVSWLPGPPAPSATPGTEEAARVMRELESDVIKLQGGV